MRLLVISTLIVSTSAFFLTQPSALPNPQPNNGPTPTGGMKPMPGADMSLVMQMVKQILNILLPKLIANPQLVSTLMGPKPPADQFSGLMGLGGFPGMQPPTTAAPQGGPTVPPALQPPAQPAPQPAPANPPAPAPQPQMPQMPPSMLPPFSPHHHHHHHAPSPPAPSKPLPFMPPAPPPMGGPSKPNPLMGYAAVAAAGGAPRPHNIMRPGGAMGGLPVGPPGRGMGYIPTNDAMKDMHILELLNDPVIGFVHDPRMAGMIPPVGAFSFSIGDKVKDYIQYKLMSRRHTRPLSSKENRLLMLMGDPPKEFFMAGGFGGSRLGGLGPQPQPPMQRFGGPAYF